MPVSSVADMGRPQILRPFVTAWLEAPVLKPDCFVLSKRLTRYDLPVRYIPAMETMEMGFERRLRYYLAWEVR